MMRLASPVDSTASVKAELERQLQLLSALVRRADAAVGALLAPDEGDGWRGPANWAFGLALDSLRREASVAVDTLRLAQRLTEAAVYEADSGV